MTTDELRALGNAATKGPWTVQGVGDHGYPQRIVGNDDGLVLVAETFDGNVDEPAPHAEFIAGARNHWDALMAVAEAARWMVGDGDGFGGYSPHSCIFCECYLLDEPVTHDPDCEWRILRSALDALTPKEDDK